MDDRSFDQDIAVEWIDTVESEDGSVREKDLYPNLQQWFEVVNPKRIVDIGCGQGICSDKVDLSHCEYTGVEPSAFLLERARELYPQPNKNFIRGNIYSLPLPDDYFDAVFSIAVWHLLEDKKKAAAELGRILKKNGHFMIATANPEIYEEWMNTYSEGEKEGLRFKGYTHKEDGTKSLDILYLHSLEDIITSLNLANLVIQKTTTFRTAISIQGQKKE